MDLSVETARKELQEIIDLLPAEVTWADSFFKGPPSLPVIDAPGGSSFKLDRRSKRFSSSKPVWVRYITFASIDPGKFKESVSFKYVTISGEEKQKKLFLNQDKGNCFVWIEDLVTGFDIKSGARFVKAEVSSIDVCGFDLDELAKASNNAVKAFALKKEFDERLSNFETEIAQKKSSLASLENEEADIRDNIDRLKENLERIAGAVAEAQEELDKVSGDCENAQSSLETLGSKEISLQNNVEQLRELAGSLNREIAQERQILEKLTSDRSLISDEYRDYVREGRSQSFWYLLFSVLPVFVIFFSVQQIYDSSEAILAKEFDGLSGVISAFVQRIPFALVLGAAVYYSWTLVSGLLTRVFKIHNDRLTLARLLVIAKDTVFSSAHGLDVNDEVKFRERVVLKIELLKSHLARDLSQGFEYRGNSPASSDKTSSGAESQD